MAKPKKASPKSPPKQPKEKGAAREKKRFNSPIDEDSKALFLHHLPIVLAARKKVVDSTNALRTLYKTAKGDGFLKADFDYAENVSTPDKEAGTKDNIRRRLLIARFMGSDLGHQLDLFSEPERVPAVDRAYEEGQTASMQNKAASPPYDPSTEQYRSWLDGWGNHQEKLAKGFTATEPVKSKGNGFHMDADEFAAEQAAAASALAEHGLDEDSAEL